MTNIAAKEEGKLSFVAYSDPLAQDVFCGFVSNLLK